MEPQPAIVIDHVTKKFTRVHQAYGSLKGLLLAFLPRRVDQKVVIDDLNLMINPGETVAVIGKNGAGKSTLLSLLARVYKPTSGIIAVNGRVAPLLELGAGFHPDLTGLENIFFNAVILGLSRKEVKERLDDIVKFADLDDYIDTPIHTYSSGMLMRLGFSVAVHVDADVLLVDEVLAVGDAEFQAKCYKKIHEFQRSGKTILFVSHDMQAVQRVATRVIWMDSGQIKSEGEAAQVIKAYIDHSPIIEDGIQ
jgi:ABC-type polysaccharide/polyol phosphate transport system ATPase subunit